MDHVDYMKREEWFPFVLVMLQLQKYRLVRVINYFLLICFTTKVIHQTYIFLKHFKMSYFLQYAPFYFLITFISLSLLVNVLAYHIYNPYFQTSKDKFFWSLSMASQKMAKRIVRECKLHQIKYFTEVFLAFCFSVTIIYVWSSDPKRFVPVPDVIYSGYYSYFHGLMSIFIGISAFNVITSVWYSHYMLLYLKFQVYLLMDTLEVIENDSDGDIALLEDEDYQKKISKLLNFFIDRHVEIFRYSEMLYEAGLFVNTCYALGSPLIGLYIIFLIYSNEISWFISGMFFVSYGFVVVIIANEVQLFEDASHDLATATYNLRWYLWNSKNMKAYSIIHTFTTSRIMKFPIPTFITCNLTILKTYAKFLYAVANIFHTLQKIK